MKDFMMLFLGGEDYSKMSPEQAQARMGKWFAWHAKMEKDGIVKSGEALQEKVTRVVGPDRTVTDIAASEVKELVGGFYVIQAKDVEQVIEIAQDFPDYDLGGSVEIREIMVFDQ